MTVLTLANLENRVRDLTKDKKCRLGENFLDFDKLRSGFVTATQFSRILKTLLDIQPTEQEFGLLKEKYGDAEGNRINWRSFVHDIEGFYDPADFKSSPEAKMLKTINSSTVGISAPREKLGDRSFDSLRAILSRIIQYNQWYGYDLRDCFKQFDTVNTGEISESQFYRSLPGPKDLNEQELTLLVERYKSLKNAGNVDYLSFVNDIDQLRAGEKSFHEGDLSAPQVDSMSHKNEKREDFFRPSLSMILDRIRFAAYRRGIRVMDFFLDYDKLRHDAITRSQFSCALMLAVGKEAQLTKEEVQMLINYYAKCDGSNLVSYRDFCRTVDQVSDPVNLEKDPLNYPKHLPPEALTRGLPVLSTEEEQIISNLLDKMRTKVRKNGILVYPYFRDFDLGSGITRAISCSQFARVLQTLGLGVSDEDCHRLARKFCDPTTGLVNYAIFCQAIDPTFTAQKYGVTDYVDPNFSDQSRDSIVSYTVRGNKLNRNWEELVTPVIKTAGDNLPIETLLNRIRHIVLTNRIALKPWFQSFDQLRSGYVTHTQFTRALTAAGITRLAYHELSPAQVGKIMEVYSSPHDKNMINWVDFVNDVDSVFTLPNLEKNPSVKVLPQETYLLPNPGTGDWESATPEMKDLYEKSMAILRRKILERRMLLLPDFLAFDKSHRGYITPHNFRQLVTMFNFPLSPEEIDAIIARHATDNGFEYRTFLNVLDPPLSSETEYRYPERLRTVQEANILGKQRKEMEPVIRDTEGVLDQIKMEVYRRRIRLADAFRDHDNLNHGCLPKATFRRCIGSLPITVGETALSLIEDRFQTKAGDVNWRAFCEEIESVFRTDNLEKDPLIEPKEYKPLPAVKQNYLSKDVAQKADRALMKIADKVRQRRLQLSPMFNDFDETHRLTVSQNQFRRVLMTLDLADMLSEEEWSCLYWKYRHPIGVVDNINYQAFVEDVYREAGMDPYIP